MSQVENAWVCIIGLGSNHGSDRIGWEIVSQITNFSQLCLQATADPLTILEVPPECKLLIVVDACIGSHSPGTIHRFVWPDSRLKETSRVSSHGIGLVEALCLAETLQKLPDRVTVFAVEVDLDEKDSKLNPGVEAAIPNVVAMIIGEAAPELARTE